MLDDLKHDVGEGFKVAAQDERSNQVSEQVLTLELKDVQVALSNIGSVNEDLTKQTHTFGGLLLSWASEIVGKAVDKGLM